MMGEVASGIKAFQKGMREEETKPAQLDANANVNAASETEKSKDA
ncbi:hypothetical protein [Devosia sp. DBB001]|nr:hypothetical protein [Devosia sp. DBB001]